MRDATSTGVDVVSDKKSARQSSPPTPNEQDRFWWKNAVFYSLYINTFAGDVRGLTAKLDYLNSLGVDCVHLLPHYPSPMVDDGFDVSDYYGVREELGTLDDFRALVEAAHARGIRILIDWPINHVSSEHPWFVEARSSKNNPKRDYFIWSNTAEELEGANNAFSHLDKPSNWIPNSETGDYYFATFYPDQPDLNWNNQSLFNEMMRVADFWLDIGVDGFRLDAASHLIKKEGSDSKGLPETHALIKRIRAHIEKRAPQAVLLAEATETVDDIKQYFGDGDGDECHTAYHFPLVACFFLGLIRGEHTCMDKINADANDIPKNAAWSVFLRNHDELLLKSLTEAERAEIFEYCDPDKRHAFKEDRGIAMRLASIFKKEPEKIREAFDTLTSLPCPFILYYGEEIGMRDDHSMGPVLDTRRYVRGQFDWEEAERQMHDPNSLFSFVAARIRDKKEALKARESAETVAIS